MIYLPIVLLIFFAGYLVVISSY